MHPYPSWVAFKRECRKRVVMERPMIEKGSKVGQRKEERIIVPSSFFGRLDLDEV